ncbi:organic cation transporter protein [Neocloeon triangulifer]|uniref:organic cation transporter protein n=1 Tax=Neocloeon triangulifer TaxID=2078957 RepID=UPI00286F236F|nr:organic cation transporter protein [Neocloeon triangulifer]
MATEQKAAPKTAEAVAAEPASVDFDDVLPHLGEFGRYQKLLFLLLAPFMFFVAFVYFSQIFITLTPDHWCHIPGLEFLTPEERVRLAIPASTSSPNGFDMCRMYNVNFTRMRLEGRTMADPSWPTVKCQYGWEFNYTEIPYSTVTSEFGWVCDNDSLATWAQAIFFLGAITGGLLFGWIADHYGRIPTLVGTNLVGFAAGMATPLTSTFWEFALCRFFVGMAFDNCFTMMYILVLEYVGPSWRTFVANMSIAIYFTLGTVMLPWMAYFIADWKLFCVATSMPLLLAVLTPWIVPESARWLVSQGKIDRAIKIMKKFERINKKKVDPQIYIDFKDSCVRAQKEEDQGKSYSVIDLFKTPRMRRITLLLIAIWMIVSLVYDGHVRSVGALGLNVFVTFTIACSTEFPADTLLILFLDRWGRRWLACGTLIVSGIFSLLSTMVPQGAASAALAIMGRFSVNIAYNIGLQYAAELLPTVVRAQGVALIHIMGYVASIMSPFIVYLGTLSATLPFLVLGGLSILGGCLALFLPETLNHELPLTLQDGEEFGKDQKFLEFPCCGNKTYSDEVNSSTEVGRSTFYRADAGRSSARASMRASIRGETFRSSMIVRSSMIRHRQVSKDDAAAAETTPSKFLTPPELGQIEKQRY